MPKTYEQEDPNRLKLIEDLKEASNRNDAGIWKAVAKELSRSRRNRRSVDIWRINRYTSKGDTVVVPGKLLGDGALDHKVNVAAFRFTESVRKKVELTGGDLMTIQELIKKNPKGSGVKIMG
jgi:large subunit ribosomal protein L18e